MTETAIPVSVLILTKNEQHDLPGCLKSVAWCDDVHVFDSGSTDDTLAIARAHGANVVQRTYPPNSAPFGGDEAAHRNWGLSNTPFKHEWVLMLDADERTTPHLLASIHQALAHPSHCVAFRFCRRDHFLGTWLKHVTPSPMHIRLVRPGRVRYDRLINSVLTVDGPVGDLDTYFDHHPFSKGIAHWFAKHNGYSDLEAREIASGTEPATHFKWRVALFGQDVSERRKHQKGIYYRMPLRPLVMFLGLYIGKRGFLDGRAGLAYATLRAIYEYMIVLKAQELQMAQQPS